ncbi:MAG: HYR domain-containing protein, partial [Bacteroidota bacterium]|nr:HYR domain-containing protein [Bacteroidota bacterium]
MTLTRTYRATDDCGNSATCSQTIIVFDDIAPAITCPTNLTVQCANQVPAANTGAIVTSDNCGGTVTVTSTDATTNQICASQFTVTRTYRATDLCGNSATCNQIITVFDNTLPVITCPANVTVSCAADAPVPNTASVTFSDNCGTATVTHLGDVTTNQTCPNNFIITRTYRAIDQCGNSATCSQVITVADLTPPVAICNDFMIEFGNQSSATITPEDIDNGSTDNCGGVTLSLSQTEFTCEQFVGVNSIPVTLTVTDQCGNSSTCIANVAGIGGLLEIECPDDITINLGPGECSAFVNYVVTASSLCGGTMVEITQIDTSGLTSGDAFPIGVTVQTYIATNGSDTVSCSFSITIIEWDGPVYLACNDTVNVSVDANCEAHLFADMILEGDNYGCYDDFIITVEDYGSDTGWIVIVGLPINNCYTITITDPETGNSCWGTACLEDKLPPQLICACPPGSDADSCTISCLDVDQLAAGNIPPNLYPEVIENCGVYSLEIAELIVDDQGCGEGGITITWVVIDSSGLSDTCIQEFN